MINYSVFGPFKVPRKESGLFNSGSEAKREFWQTVGQSHEGLSKACGCYVLSVRNKVWYVGLAQAQDFAHECFSVGKVNKLNDAIIDGKGDAYLYLLARRTPAGRFVAPSSRHGDIEDLEKMLIAFALERNEDLLNKKDTKFYRNTVVPGILNSSRRLGRASSVLRLKKVLGIKMPSISLKDLIETGIVKAGKLSSRYKGTNLEADLLSSGLVRFQEGEPKSPSGAAVAAKQSVTGEAKATDGWAFWQYVNAKGKRVPLKSARREYQRKHLQ